ncbi:MAG TPA: pyridoxal-phosphate dependent enzyme [Gemmatimonadales bacterium]|nr:pyridoxal-phosphate dependent enzyme [Gemmatimonadales bacterium]
MSDPLKLTKKIRAALAPCDLGSWPTALEQAPALARVLGLEELAIKREDRSAARYGGNKVRGLEFLLAGAAPGTTFVTVGGAGSTHCLATAVHASTLGHRTAVALFPQPETPTSRAVAAACAALATVVVRARARATLPLAVLEAWHRARGLDRGPRRWIPGGGAHPRAVVGHLLAGLELALHAAVPPDAIVVPLGTGGTAAGLLLALGTLGWGTRLVAVRVAPAIVANRWRTLRLARAARRLLARAGVALPAPAAPDVVEGLGRGYGWPTADGEAAARLAGKHGLVLDPTYGAKTFAVLLRRGTWNVQRVVFWHTFAVPETALESVP